MAISPTVNNMQQAMVKQQGSSAEQMSFDSKFGEQAYRIISSKYAELQGLIITFKVLESDVAEGFAAGAFILRNGKGVLYVPVIMVEGSIVSCEMAYDKDANAFMPLIPEEVKRIVGQNRLTDPTLAGKNISLENTSKLYKNMFRPPTSSMVTMAANNKQVEQLSNGAKEALSEFFNQNPELLSKVACFYDVRALGTKLSKTAATISVNQKEKLDEVPSLIKIDEVSKDTLANLAEGDKKALLDNGYVIPENKTEAKSDNATKTKMVALNDASSDIINSISANELMLNSTTGQKCGYLVNFTGVELELEPSIVIGKQVITKNGTFVVSASSNGLGNSMPEGTYYKNEPKYPLVMSAPEEHIIKDFLSAIGFNSVGGFFFPKIGKSYKSSSVGQLFIATPNKAGGYKIHDVRRDLYLGPEDKIVCNKTSSGGDTTLNFVNTDPSYKNDQMLKITLTDRVSYGVVKPSDDKYTLIAPKESLLLASKTIDTNSYVKTLQALLKLVNTVYPKVNITKDLNKIQVKDSITKVASTFYSEGDAALHLVNNYHLTPKQAETTLTRGGALFYKIASPFVQPAQEEYPQEYDGSVMPADQVQAQQQQPLSPEAQQQQAQQQAQQIQVDQKMMENAAAMEDEQLMDTGMLASLVGNDDIKSILVDHLPSFLEALTNIGRTLIVTSINKKELIEYFGTEQYNTFQSKLRRVFVSLGEATFGLKKYIKMA